ncbi:hypothetical protein TB2_035567 [Malus domestica]
MAKFHVVFISTLESETLSHSSSLLSSLSIMTVVYTPPSSSSPCPKGPLSTLTSNPVLPRQLASPSSA